MARYPLKFARLFLVTLCVGILLLILGCGSDTDTKVVDFSKTLPADRQGDRSPESSSFRVAVAAMISAKETVIHYHQLLDYIAGKLDRKIEFTQRKTYGEINELLAVGKIDVGFICSGPYANYKDKYGFEALAVPQVQGKHFYQSYLIVNKNSPFQNLDDLRGKIFAFTDPESNTGKLVPTFWLARQGEEPEHFFSKTIYTYSHDNSILAVAMSMVDGATVHEQIWEYYNDKNPIYTSRTRVIKKSKPFGNPLMVASKSLPNHLKERIRQLFFSMHRDPDGKRILDELMIDRFIAPKDEWYDPILAMKNSLQMPRTIPHEIAKP